MTDLDNQIEKLILERNTFEADNEVLREHLKNSSDKLLAVWNNLGSIGSKSQYDKNMKVLGGNNG